jgi:hypothetical protein
MKKGDKVTFFTKDISQREWEDVGYWDITQYEGKLATVIGYIIQEEGEHDFNYFDIEFEDGNVFEAISGYHLVLLRKWIVPVVYFIYDEPFGQIPEIHIVEAEGETDALIAAYKKIHDEEKAEYGEDCGHPNIWSNVEEYVELLDDSCEEGYILGEPILIS